MTGKDRCRAKNPATCPHHGSTFSTIDFSKGVFEADYSSIKKTNLSHSKTFQFFLDSEELKAIESYCEQDYLQINRFLYGNQEYANLLIKNKIKLLDRALKKYPKPETPRVVYRAGKPYNANKPGHYEKFDTLEQAEDFYRREYFVGKIIEFKGFTSTTEDPNCLVDFTAPGFDSHPPQGTNSEMTREQYNMSLGTDGTSNIIYEIVTRDGVPLSSFSHTYSEKEQEILLPRNARYKVKAVHANKLMNFINRLPFGDKNDKRLVTIIQLEEL